MKLVCFLDLKFARSRSNERANFKSSKLASARVSRHGSRALQTGRKTRGANKGGHAADGGGVVTRRLPSRSRSGAAALFCLLAIGLLAPRAAAEDFYRGKTITVIIGSGPGGGYDFYGRLVTRHLGRHLA